MQIINYTIKRLKLEQIDMMKYKTCSGTYRHARLILAIEIWNLKIVILESLPKWLRR